MNLFDHERTLRLGVFAGLFALLALAECLLPRRRLSSGRGGRWAVNLGLAAVNALVVRVVAPAGAVGVALWAEERGWGLLRLLDVPFWLATPLAVVVLDLVVFGQHVLFHRLPLLWQLHRLHHTDHDFDVTTGLRFHPLEMVLSLGIKGGAALVLGAPAAAVLGFEVLLNAASLFTHGNVRLPTALDRALRLVLVTPDMHRVHHSADVAETNSNFGFHLAFWDRLFGTYRAEPAAGHEAMTIGVGEESVGAAHAAQR